MNTPISIAIRVAGTQGALAKRCGVSQAAVSKWALGGKISAEKALSVESATNGAVTVHDLRPDIFGPPPAKDSGPPPEAQSKAA